MCNGSGDASGVLLKPPVWPSQRREKERIAAACAKCDSPRISSEEPIQKE